MKTPQELIREMKEAGIRQCKIAEITGMSDSYLSEIKHGKRSGVSFPQFLALVECHKKLMPAALRKGKKARAQEPAEAPV